MDDELLDETTVSVRYWAGARAAAGVEREQLPAHTVGELRATAVLAHPALARIMPRCSVLVDGLRSDDERPLTAGSSVEVLPPFAGG